FVGYYQDDYGAKPGPSAALAYDAFNLIVEAIRETNSMEPERIRNALKNTKDFKGVTGNYTFDESRNPQKGGVIIKINKDGEEFVKRIEP
ncbi:MAG: ABC transporter substrate-binding protein, partial [Rubrobacteridae bacterium]|nr:ABC transporter substrate-binding protein [Rubrobacteridae bacterium]